MGQLAGIAAAGIRSHVAHYRAYLIGRDDRFEKAIDLDCADDGAAIEAAKQLVDGHDVELWQQNRKITRLQHKPK